MGKDFWAIVGVGVALVGVVVASWTGNRAARSEIVEDIRDVEENLRDSEKRLGDNINRVHGDIIRVEENLGDNINRVHGDVRILLEHALRGQSDGSERPSENAQD